MASRRRRFALALHHAAVSAGTVAAPIAIALHQAGAGQAPTAPEWIELLPPGPVIAGVDGRTFSSPDPAPVVAATRLPFVVDYEHASETPGLAAPAAAWVEELDVRNGSIWGRADWTPRGRAVVAGREYRFVSPAFHHALDPGRTVVSLKSAGLVHAPNLTLTALNRQDAPMNLAALLAALSLPATTSEADALAAVRALQATATNSAIVPLDKYVPVEQHQATLLALNDARLQIAAHDHTKLQSRAEALVDEAVRAGRLVPAVRADYVQLALNAFDRTKAALDKMPVVLAAGESAAARAAETETLGTATNAKGLTVEQVAICSRIGVTQEAYAISLAALRAA